MKKLLINLLLLMSSTNGAFAQNLHGPELTAMGHNGAAVREVWSITANTAGVTTVIKPTIAIAYANYPFDHELNSQAIVFVTPLKNKANVIGLELQRYGIDVYNEIKAGLAFAKKFGDQLSIGTKVNFHQLKINNYGTTTSFSIDAGIYYNLNEQLTLGAYVNNPSGQNYRHTTIATQIPSTIHIGASYQASNKIAIATTISKDFEYSTAVAFGLAYQLLESVGLRGGLSLKPFKQYGGFSFRQHKLGLAMAIESDPHLGYSPQIAISYAF